MRRPCPQYTRVCRVRAMFQLCLFAAPCTPHTPYTSAPTLLLSSPACARHARPALLPLQHPSCAPCACARCGLPIAPPRVKRSARRSGARLLLALTAHGRLCVRATPPHTGALVGFGGAVWSCWTSSTRGSALVPTRPCATSASLPPSSCELLAGAAARSPCYHYMRPRAEPRPRLHARALPACALRPWLSVPTHLPVAGLFVPTAARRPSSAPQDSSRVPRFVRLGRLPAGCLVRRSRLPVARLDFPAGCGLRPRTRGQSGLDAATVGRATYST
jgi:hypothetical protein